ncbi:uncharacterized protein LOC130752749 [Actinidia eriantha]|uniref:uncharacterized protein LOC130752749 n=1 Tax=Actinidia eriantha TaxID=165200 RepID=UPI002590E138|nr:uncharacterized protein LOC130752749 [Actinidia eriantha]
MHLGGPDTITAYSLEDNGLWMRHFLGLVVQVAVAVYIIFMSWKNSWFSFLSIPALVVEIIKYAERTWVLKSVNGDESGDIVPFNNLHEENAGTAIKEDEYLHALVLGKELTMNFKIYMDHYDISYIDFSYGGKRYDSKLFWDALKIEMGLMYDLLYTKAAINYSKIGCILRCMSFACTMFVLVGIFWLIFRLDKMYDDHYSKVDIVITGVLLVGALALEIYAVIVLFSSDWAMLWLIKHNKGKYVIQLRQQFSWLFPKKKWSKMIGQFNLLDYWVKDVKLQNPSRRILGLFLRFGYKEKFHMYVHNTNVPIPLTLINGMIMDYCKGTFGEFVFPRPKNLPTNLFIGKFFMCTS